MNKTTDTPETGKMVDYLRTYNRWRRGTDDIEHPNPTTLGKMIEDACNAMVLIERDRDEWKARSIAAEMDSNQLRKDLCLAHADAESLRKVNINIQNELTKLARFTA